MPFCPLNDKECTAECAWYNAHLQGCHVVSFVINFNRISRKILQPHAKDMAGYKEKFKGKTDEEIKKVLFSG